MKLYVCYTSAELHIRPGGHPCANAYKALRQAGYDPEVVKVYGLGPLPDFLQTPGRKLVKEKTGAPWVPALETDDGAWISDSKRIIAWAEQHPAT
jgi:hypothetical protein